MFCGSLKTSKTTGAEMRLNLPPEVGGHGIGVAEQLGNLRRVSRHLVADGMPVENDIQAQLSRPFHGGVQIVGQVIRILHPKLRMHGNPDDVGPRRGHGLKQSAQITPFPREPARVRNHQPFETDDFPVRIHNAIASGLKLGRPVGDG
jgi:hypothetical protein